MLASTFFDKIQSENEGFENKKMKVLKSEYQKS
jgi:hypothetical protein